MLLQKDLAKLKIEQAGLVPRIVKGTSDTVPPGQVSEQDPPGGTKWNKGSTVTLTVSTGKPKVKVPNVVGQSLDSALPALAAAGLQPHIVRIYSSQQPDTVTAQQPHAGDSVVKGSSVRINVSRGAKPVPVPDVTGQPYANAKSALEGQGFQVTKVEVQSDQPQGTVVAEDPPQGTSVPRGTTIRLSVSKGPATTQVPDVTGQSQSTAESLLTGAGLTPSVVYDPVTDPSQDGIVISTDPSAGADAKSGEVIIMHVGQLQQGTPGGGDTTTGTTTTTSSP
jgi:serine/threonine-protein kinase